MRNVENETFIHLNTCAAYEVGKTYTFGNKTNPFFKFYEEFVPNILMSDKELLKEYSMYVRERIFEDIRLESFPNAPSRMKCLWLMPNSAEALNYWRGQLRNCLNLVTFKCSGVIHCGDSRYLSVQHFKLQIQKSLAKDYWSEKKLSPQDKYQEILFAGSATVLDISPLPQAPNLLEPETL